MPAAQYTIVHYCQYVLGLGHLFRSLEIDRALAGQRVVLVTGGRPVEMDLPPHVVHIALPGLALEHQCSDLVSLEPGRSVASIKEEREKRLQEVLRDTRPDVFLVELFPFGRNLFRFELLPALQQIRKGKLGRVRTVSSQRDVVEPKYNGRSAGKKALRLLNYYFDALLVHADAKVQPLEASFERVADIDIPIHYTGYITPRPAPGARQRLRAVWGLGPEDRLVVASIGGGRVAGDLLLNAARALPLLPSAPRVAMQIFSGPFLPDDEYARLQDLAAATPNLTVDRFADDFLDRLAAADLSLGLAGSTIVNAAAAGTPSLVWPHANQEQALRAARLAAAGACDILDDPVLTPETLAQRLTEALARPRPAAPPLDIDGAANSARFLVELAEGRG